MGAINGVQRGTALELLTLASGKLKGREDVYNAAAIAIWMTEFELGRLIKDGYYTRPLIINKLPHARENIYALATFTALTTSLIPMQESARSTIASKEGISAGVKKLTSLMVGGAQDLVKTVLKRQT
ncbi:hypothetical protein BDK51DRAFT_35174 [Blyttiomyces helicus]|uniref:Uncharacterized protein n=1 Tax=Blyttiomyces helicus TaxID=388810 RepID=A0A4P9WCE1_9FUNG|nr:hypothetical protein BDK51DRAFT_35174 [Blyttiomyces helicus]|eukprot:RKO88878.1 hypothetical protein BDK51DRAFT_35174 [Blyttiomyces helicus]